MRFDRRNAKQCTPILMVNHLLPTSALATQPHAARRALSLHSLTDQPLVDDELRSMVMAEAIFAVHRKKRNSATPAVSRASNSCLSLVTKGHHNAALEPHRNSRPS